ncbi:MAG: hypothetical protein ACXVB9_02460 [Bdellovibrionota bacterium]
MKQFGLILSLFFALPLLAQAAPDYVHVTIQSSGGEIALAVDHPTRREPGWAIPHWVIGVNCAGGLDTPVVFSNESDSVIGLVSPLGLAELSAAGRVGPHAATYRSVPKGEFNLVVRAPGLRGFDKTVFMLSCAL